jgi:hypothetical protein
MRKEQRRLSENFGGTNPDKDENFEAELVDLNPQSPPQLKSQLTLEDLLAPEQPKRKRGVDPVQSIRANLLEKDQQAAVERMLQKLHAYNEARAEYLAAERTYQVRQRLADLLILGPQVTGLILAGISRELSAANFWSKVGSAEVSLFFTYFMWGLFLHIGDENYFDGLKNLRAERDKLKKALQDKKIEASASLSLLQEYAQLNFSHIKFARAVQLATELLNQALSQHQILKG